MPGAVAARATPSRKKQHVDIILSRDVQFRAKTTGLERLEFVHNALPELDLQDIDTSVRFLGHNLAFPFLISCMTGGYAGALSINRRLAEICEELRIAMGVGSQRQALEDHRLQQTFSVVRSAAPTIPVIGNIGAAEVAALDLGAAQRLVDLIRADAFAVHLNPLQELLQPEGTPRFRGVLAGIERLAKGLSVPVIVKEIGAGISAEVARRLIGAGVRHIDVAGAGGTTWAGVELLRRRDKRFLADFRDWGIPLATVLKEVAPLRKEGQIDCLIASGGIASGIDAAKCLSLGADVAGAARPVIIALKKGGSAGVRSLLTSWGEQLRAVMFLTGSATVAALQHAPLIPAEQPHHEQM
jgi:isopentenyl-diphosphate delta-isomerase